MRLFCVGFLVVVAAASPLWANDAGPRTFDLPQGITVSVPKGWKLKNADQLRSYERTRDAALGDAANAKGSDARVPFQAVKQVGETAMLAMMTVGPGEATQAEVARWADDKGTIQELGKLLGAAQVQGLEAAGASDAIVGPASLLQLGEKTALHFSITFSGPNGQSFVGDKYFIYTETRTVIFSFQTAEDVYAETSSDRETVLDGLKIH